MANIYKGTLELIGNTPLMEVTNIERELKLEASILVKLEYLNPAGSVKDRAAKYMIQDAEEKGLLKPGAVIIEPTSGNTGIGLASIAASRGPKFSENFKVAPASSSRVMLLFMWMEPVLSLIHICITSIVAI